MKRWFMKLLACTLTCAVLAGCGNTQADDEAIVNTESGTKPVTIYVKYKQITKAVNLDYATTHTFQFSDIGEISSVSVDYGGKHDNISWRYDYLKGDLGVQLNQFWEKERKSHQNGKDFDQSTYELLLAEIGNNNHEQENTTTILIDEEGKPVHQLYNGKSQFLLEQYAIPEFIWQPILLSSSSIYAETVPSMKVKA